MSARALWLGGAATLLISGATVAAEPDVAGDAYPTLKGGADLRVRQEYYDNIPRVTGPSVENNYLRVRTRGWGEIDFAPNVLVLGRLTNEFRYYWEPNEDAVTDIWPFAGEAAVDALYLDWKGLLDNTLDVRLGRQDMMYGNGRVLMDGTPKDGSRTFYMDGFKLSYRGIGISGAIAQGAQAHVLAAFRGEQYLFLRRIAGKCSGRDRAAPVRAV